jgi:hypothetical protein
MFWNKQKGQVRADEKCADALFVVLTDNLKKDGRIRAEDVIAAAASITGERCIEAAGNFNPRKHNFVPGSRVFSDKVNELISGDSAGNDLDAVPAESIIGILRDRLLPSGYAKSDFSPLTVIFEHFAANVGRPSEWGRVPISVPEGNRPFILPLRVNYETRSIVDRVFQPLPNPRERLTAAVLTLSKVLIAVQQVIDKKVALLLALQTVNGMAKTAPMTDEAMLAIKSKSSAP